MPELGRIATQGKKMKEQRLAAAAERIGPPLAWAEEGMSNYGAGAEAWLQRWKVNYQQYTGGELAILDAAIAIVRQRMGVK